MSAKAPVVLLALAGLGSAGAALAAPGDLQVHGFVAQGWVLSQGNNVHGSSDDAHGSGEFRELGINASWRPLGSLLVSAQMAAVEAGKSVDEDVLLEYGLADYTAFQGEGGRLGLRAGRLKLPIGFYNDSRDVVFTRPGIFMPNSVYLDVNGARTFGYFSLESAGLYGDWFAGRHAVYAEFLVAPGQRLDDAAESAILRTQASGRFELDRGVVARLADDYDGGRWRAALSVLRSDLAYVQAATSPLDPLNRDGQFDFDQAVLSLQFNGERLSLTSELVARRIELDDLSGAPFPFAALIGETRQDPGGYYLQAAWRMTPKWQWLLRYDEQIRDLQDRHGREQAANAAAASTASGGVLPAQPRHYYFARDWTAGLRHDVLPNLAVWAEFHYVDGVGWVNPLDNPGFGSGNADRYWNLVSVMLGLRF